MASTVLRRKSETRNPHVRPDEGKAASARPRRGLLPYGVGWAVGALYAFAALGDLAAHVDPFVGTDGPGHTYPAAALIVPAAVSQDFRGELKKIFCGLDCQPFRIVAQ